jgi:hypothetical protein
MSRQGKNRLNRRVLLAGWLGVPGVLSCMSGCNQEVVEVKGGTVKDGLPDNASDRSKKAAKAEEEILKKTKKIR